MRPGPTLAAVALCLTGCGNGTTKTTLPPEGADVQAAVARTAAPTVIVAFGDSLYAGYGLPAGAGLAPVLERRLRAAGTPARVVNASVSGSSSAAGRKRLGPMLDGLDRRPALVLVGFGAVDMLAGEPPAALRANLAAILDTLRARGIPAMLTGMRAGPGFGDMRWRAYVPVYAELSRRYEVSLYPFLLASVAGDPALVLADRIHPSAAGVEQIATDLVGPVPATLPEAKRR